MNARQLAQEMERAAKEFYKRYAAGQRISNEDLNLLATFGVWLYHGHLWASQHHEDARPRPLPEVNSISEDK